MLKQEVNLLYKNFIATINEFGTHLLSHSDEDIEYYIFEEFDADSVSFLYWRNLKKLLKANLIDEQIYKLSLKLRRNFRKLEGTLIWSARSVKYERKWLKLLLLSDNIKELIERYTESNRYS